MRYNIVPLMLESLGVRLEDIKKDNLEEVLQSIPSLRPSFSGFYLTAKLRIPLEAKVLRNLESGREIVRLSSDGRSVDLFRTVSDVAGDIGVSCDPHSDEVPVDTLNIEFRDYYDGFTDRGIVWVCPGDPAVMHFFVKAQALKTHGLVAEIVTAAEEAVKTKVLTHFQ